VSTMTAPSSSGLTFAKARGARKVKNNIATGLVTLAFGIALVPLVWLLFTVISKGFHVIVDAGWWSSDQAGIDFKTKGGGASAAIIGTAEQVALCTLISVPIAILVGIYLVEYARGPLAKVTTFMVDILTGIPSIVAALFIYALWVSTIGLQRVPFAVTLALVILMIPTVVRSTEEMLKLVPNELREASYALGVPKWKTIMKVVLPTAFSGIVTGVLLGLARVMGETAPLIILGPYRKVIASDLFGGLMATLPTMINNDRGENLQPALDRVWGAALTLILLIFILNLLGRFIGRFSKVKS
jgi:phosphate transport system permease protein